jgi:hypothetical protein
MIEPGMRCVRCGYALVELFPEVPDEGEIANNGGVCPECALPVADSQVAWSREDAQRYLRRMRLGAEALLLGFAVPLALPVAALLQSLMLAWAIAVLMGCGWCGGWWLVSTLPPRWLAFGAERYRFLLRGLVCVQLACGVVGGALLLGELAGYGTVTRLVNTRGFVPLVLTAGGFLLPAPLVWLLGFLMLRGFAAGVLVAPRLALWCRFMAFASVLCLLALFTEAMPLVAMPFAILGTISMVWLRMKIGRMIVPKA